MPKNPTISVIIPTLNEEVLLRNTVEHTLSKACHLDELEIIVVDAGSSDATVASIEDLPVQLYVEPQFKLQKAKSLNYGIKKSSGDILLFLDADTLLPVNFDTLILQELNEQKCVGGAFEMRFISPSPLLFILSKINSIRYRIWKTFYGDQGIFCTKGVALEVGGFPNTLMEAAFFCKQLMKYGKLAVISEPVMPSPRRFEGVGFWKVFGYDVLMWLKFMFGFSLKKQAKDYWKRNLENG